MMCIQTPGSFVWVASLAKRLGKAGWSTWGTYLVTGVLQGILLVMAISFVLRDRKAKKGYIANRKTGHMNERSSNGETREGRPTDDESTNLIGNER